MSYAPNTDFMALVRNTAGGERVLSMPGLDFTVAALARAGFINLSVGQTAPIADQATTAWFKPAVPSWAAEGVLYLWNVGLATYQPATPSLWKALIAAAP